MLRGYLKRIYFLANLQAHGGRLAKLGCYLRKVCYEVVSYAIMPSILYEPIHHLFQPLYTYHQAYSVMTAILF